MNSARLTSTIIRQKARARGPEDYAIVISPARQEPDDRGQALVEGVVDPGQDIPPQIPEGIDQAIDGEAGCDDHPDGRQQPAEIGAEPLSGFHHASPPRFVKYHEKRLLSSPPHMSGADPGRLIPEVQEFADVVKIKKGQGGEKADKHRRGGTRAPLQ